MFLYLSALHSYVRGYSTKWVHSEYTLCAQHNVLYPTWTKFVLILEKNFFLPKKKSRIRNLENTTFLKYVPLYLFPKNSHVLDLSFLKQAALHSYVRRYSITTDRCKDKWYRDNYIQAGQCPKKCHLPRINIACFACNDPHYSQGRGTVQKIPPTLQFSHFPIFFPLHQKW